MGSELKSSVDKAVSPKNVFFVFLVVSMIFFVWKIRTLDLKYQNVDVKKQILFKDVVNLSRAQDILLQKYMKGGDYFYSPVKIYAITPTYSRYVQKAELTRISQTLQLVPNVHWIVIEDSKTKTELVSRLLLESNLIYTHLNRETIPPKLKVKRGHKGIDQRNEGLKWLRENLIPTFNTGVVYFMDDDNTYSVKLFKEISKVKKVGVWPVGLVAGYNVETPVVSSKTGKITDFRSGWKGGRKFQLDMAGFAINLELILRNKKALFLYKTVTGYLENDFLKFFVSKPDELEPLANNCTEIYVWHTKTQNPLIKGRFPGYET